MASSDIVHFAFGLDDSTLEDQDRLRFTNQLLPELRQMDEVEQANLIEEPTLEEGAKGYKQLLGWLSADVSITNLTGFLSWLGSRLADKQSKVEITLGDKVIKLESDDLAEAEATAKRLIAILQGEVGG
jgi:hypothetical protein